MGDRASESGKSCLLLCEVITHSHELLIHKLILVKGLSWKRMAVLTTTAYECLSIPVVNVLIEVLTWNRWWRSSIIAVSCRFELPERESSTITEAVLLSVVRIH